MEFGQPDFEALRKKSDERFKEEASRRNESGGLSPEEGLSYIDVAHVEGKIEEGRKKLKEGKDAQIVIIKESLGSEYWYCIEKGLEDGRFSDALALAEIKDADANALQLEVYGIEPSYVRTILEEMIFAQIKKLLEAKNISVLDAIFKREEDAAIFFRQIEKFASIIPQEIMKLESFQGGLKLEVLADLISGKASASVETAKNYVKLGLITKEEKEDFFASDIFREKLKKNIEETFENFLNHEHEPLIRKKFFDYFSAQLNFYVEEGALREIDRVLFENKFLRELNLEEEFDAE